MGQLNKPFSSFHSALEFYILNNPARQRSHNPLEPTGGCKPAFKHFEGGHPDDIWASLARGLDQALAAVNALERRGFEAYWLKKAPPKWIWEDYAKHFHTDPRSFRRAVRRAKERVEDEFARRELIDPPPLQKFQVLRGGKQ